MSAPNETRIGKKTIQFSPEQRQAIETRGANLLVSAAAGAGKTAVLVARILHLLDQTNGDWDLQNILVVTFTRAAAREMKDRIGEALRARLDADPESLFYQRQLALLDRAPISTLDSFCQELVRQNFHLLGVNPGFAVLDPDEADLLRADAMDSVFEKHYADETQDGREFRRLVEAFGGRREDRALADEIRRIANFLSSTADPETWKARAFETLHPFLEAEGRAVRLETTRWGAAFQKLVAQRIDDAAERLRLALRTLKREAIPDPKLSDFLDALVEATQTSRERLLANDFDKWCEAMAATVSIRMPSVPRALDEERKEIRASIKEALIEPARKEIKALAAFEGRFTAALWTSGVRETIPLVRRLFAITDQVLAAYREEKNRLGSLDFHDLERLALEALLSAGESERAKNGTGPIAERYRDLFEHVLVDEYQDINELQNALLELVSRQKDSVGRAPNLFAVGDVKQSIYGFRLAEPDIFIEKYANCHPLDHPSDRPLDRPSDRPSDRPDPQRTFRIDLPANYRCRVPVVESVNAVFEKLMAEDLGGIPYDRAARLVVGRRLPVPDTPLPTGADPDSCPTELLLVEANPPDEDDAADTIVASATKGEAASDSAPGDSDAEDPNADDNADSATEREARALAARLWEIVGHDPDGTEASLWVHAEHPDRPEEGAVHRPARWSDIVILMRALGGKAQVFCDALRRCGLPISAPPGGGLLDTLEARDLLSTLRILDNPCQDIPLAAHLRSPLAGFADDHLAGIRLAFPNGDFHSALARYASEGPDSAVRASCAAAVDRIERWRRIARQSSVTDLIDHILDETGYAAHAVGLPEGVRRVAVLDAFRARALQFDSFARRGLARFLRFLDQLAESGNDPAGPDAETTGANAVRLMSIHKSKGLEFPIVCVADLSRKFNLQDLYRAVSADRAWSVGMKTPGGRRGIALPSLSHKVVTEQRRRATLAEELRVLYVAMTRARDHLILSASVRNARKRFDLWTFQTRSLPAKRPLPAFMRMRAGSLFDWVGPSVACLVSNPDHGESPFDMRILETIATPEEIAHCEVAKTEGKAGAHEGAAAPSRSEMDSDTRDAHHSAAPPVAPVWKDEAGDALRRILKSSETLLPPAIRAKLSVTEIKRLWDHAHEPEDGPPVLQLDRIGSPKPPGTVESLWVSTTSDSISSCDPAPPLTAAERGTRTHLVLQHLDFAKFAHHADSIPGLFEVGERAETKLAQDDFARSVHATLLEEIDRLVSEGLIPKETPGTVDLESLVWFLTSPVGMALGARSSSLRSELPFTAELPASAVYAAAYPDLPPDALEGRFIVVQGVIDCLVVDDDGLRIYDYKTDAVSLGPSLDERVRGYATQMRLYARAASAIYGRPVRETALVFLHPRQIVPVSLDA